MGLIFKSNLVGNCVLCISGEDGLLDLTLIFAKMAEIVVFFSIFIIAIIYYVLSCFIIINLDK